MSEDRGIRTELGARVRLVVSDTNEVVERYASNLSTGGLFVKDDAPPPVGSTLTVELVLPDGTALCRIGAEVVHSRPITMGLDRPPGMGLRFKQLHTMAPALAARLGPQAWMTESEAVLDSPRFVVSPEAERRPLIGMDGPVVGIDLGTVNTCVAVVQNGEPTVITSTQGYETIPSVVFFADDGKEYVGHQAAERMILHPDHAVYGAKRFLGRLFASREVNTMGHFFAYSLVAGPDGRTATRINDQVIPLEEISGRVLAAAKHLAESRLNRRVNRAVITVPAYFGSAQRESVRDAARYAGLYPEKIVNEPTAAAIAFARRINQPRTVLVYDLGGGTFDVSLLHINGRAIRVLGTNGDPFLGGGDFDDRLVEYVMMLIERRHHLNLRKDAVAVQRVRFAVELAKRQLSEAERVTVDLPYLAPTSDGHFAFSTTLDRDTFEGLTQDLVDRTLTLVQSVLDHAGKRAADIDDVLLVGGQSRSPHIARAIRERFGKAPSRGVHPDEAVAIGAALLGSALSERVPFKLFDVLPHAVAVDLGNGRTEEIFPRNSRLPARRDVQAPVVSDKSGPSIKVDIYGGDATNITDNILLGTLRLPGTATDYVVGATIRVHFEVSDDGLLTAEAEHPQTRAKQSLQVAWNRTHGQRTG